METNRNSIIRLFVGCNPEIQKSFNSEKVRKNRNLRKLSSFSPFRVYFGIIKTNDSFRNKRSLFEYLLGEDEIFGIGDLDVGRFACYHVDRFVGQIAEDDTAII